jgi:predicted nuclease of predicted toxin-antitoxin system
MKLLVDMNLSPSWVKYLAEAGFESVHWLRLGPAALPMPN